jgi:hypothetical protein
MKSETNGKLGLTDLCIALLQVIGQRSSRSDGCRKCIVSRDAAKADTLPSGLALVFYDNHSTEI